MPIGLVVYRPGLKSLALFGAKSPPPLMNHHFRSAGGVGTVNSSLAAAGRLTHARAVAGGGGRAPVTSVDVAAAEVLRELDATRVSSGSELSFAEMKDAVKDKLKPFGLYLPLGEGLFSDG